MLRILEELFGDGFLQSLEIFVDETLLFEKHVDDCLCDV
jgi:hypothetical protein